MWRIFLGIVLVIGLALVVSKALQRFVENAGAGPPSIRVTIPKLP